MTATGPIDDLAALRAEIEAQRDELASQRAEIATQRSAIDALLAADARRIVETAAPRADSTATDQGDTPVSRRHALRTAGVLAAGALAGGVASVAAASPAAAASGTFTGDPAVDAQSNFVGGTGVYAFGQGFAVDAFSNDVGVRIRSLGVGVRSVSTGGTAASFDGDAIGMIAAGNDANVVLTPRGVAPADRGTAAPAGALVVDTSENLWFCHTAGTPGSWRKLSGPTTAGTYHAIDPSRVYDSRSPQPTHGVLASGLSRTVNIADRRDATTGAVTASNIVPFGATAIFANITITNTSGAGYLAANPGGQYGTSASAINWSQSGQTIANGLALKISALRNLTFVAGGPGSTDFLVDVTGYWM